MQGFQLNKLRTKDDFMDEVQDKYSKYLIVAIIIIAIIVISINVVSVFSN